MALMPRNNSNWQEEMNSKKQSFEKQVANLTILYETSQKMVKNLRKMLQDKDKIIWAHEEDIKRLQKVLKGEKEKNVLLLKQQGQESQEIHSVSEYITMRPNHSQMELQKSIDDQARQITELNQVKYNLAAEIDTLRDQLQKITNEKEEALEKIQTLSDNSKEMYVTTEEAKSEFQQYKERFAHQEREIEKVTEKVNEYNKQVILLKEENENLIKLSQKSLMGNKKAFEILENFWSLLGEKEYRITISVFYKIFRRLIEISREDQNAKITSRSLAKDLNLTSDVVYSELKEMVEKKIIQFTDSSGNDFYLHEVNLIE